MAVMLLVALGVGVLSYWSATHADGIVTARQQQLAEYVLGQTTAAVAHEQETATVSDDSVRHVHAVPLDLDWLDAHLGVWLHEHYGHDEVFVLNGKNEPIYAMQGGYRVGTGAIGPAAATISRLAVELRASLRKGAQAGVDKSSTSLGVSDFATIGERSAIVSVKPIVSDSGTIRQAPGSEYFHVSVRYIDGSLVENLAKNYWFDVARFQVRPEQDPKALSVPFIARDRSTIGYFVWEPFRPGAHVVARLAPVLGLALAVIALVVAWLLMRVRRSTMELEASEAQAQHLAFHDVLTGLPNRALFNDRLDHALARARRGEKVALLLLDLDRFKHVNDTFGHQAGDALIREFGGRLGGLLRETDTVARLGGDEFGVVLTGTGEVENVTSLCDRILAAVRQPFDVIDSRAFVGVSIGIVLAPEEGTERVDLIRKADIALYRAKAGGRNRHCFFDETMDETVKQRGVIEEELRIALASGEGLSVCYQPQVAGPGQKVVGLEALVRWHHPVRGSLSPEQFIPIAEETGLIVPLGEWVLRKACVASIQWPDLFMAINLSPIQLRVRDFADKVIDIVRETGANPRMIELEVTEGILVAEDEHIRASLQKLRTAGLRIALDDFGTGYSSLRYLRHFEVDKIKIDRSFVQHLGQSVDSAAIITAIISLGHAMGLTVTAEGVETGDQQKFLTSAGCNEMQGFLFSRAVPEDEISGFLTAQRRRRLAA